MPLVLTSPDFTHHGRIPVRYTCDGDDISPALAWSGVPPGAQSLALVVVDPDAPDPAAPKRTFVHWILYDMPPGTTGLAEAVTPGALPAGTRAGYNDSQTTGWTSPCPPIGRHRYFFRLYALDAPLGDLGTPTRGRLEHAMEGHVLESAELMGTYQRDGR